MEAPQACNDIQGFTSAEAVERLSTITGEDFALVGPLAGGETGATEVRGADGNHLVMKWEFEPANAAHRVTSVSLAERLRIECGWPVPHQRVINADAKDGAVVFILQQFMPGGAVQSLTHSFVDEVFAAHERGLGVATAIAGVNLADELVTTLRHGGRGYCLHEPLRSCDARTRRIVERIEQIGRDVTVPELRGASPLVDIVHADLHPGNLLQIDGRLSAVVDLDFAKVGDATFDLTSLAISSLGYEVERGVRTRLFAAGVHEVDEPRRSAYLGHLLLKCLDWPIRKRRLDEVEFWIEQAERHLPG